LTKASICVSVAGVSVAVMATRVVPLVATTAPLGGGKDNEGAATLAMTTTAASAIRHELSIQRFTAAMLLAAERVVRFPST
jgi:hypothetical protein